MLGDRKFVDELTERALASAAADARELNMLRHTAARAIEEAARYEKLYEDLLEFLRILKGPTPGDGE
jgi:hypothetical protein